MSTTRDRIKAKQEAANRAAVLAERHKYDGQDRSNFRKPALQDQSRYAEQLERFERTGNDWATLNRETASNLRERLETANSRKERKQIRAGLEATEENIDVLRTAARLRSYDGLEDIENQIADANRLRRGDAAGNRQQKKNANDFYDQLLSDYEAYAQREAQKRKGAEFAEFANSINTTRASNEEGMTKGDTRKAEKRRAKVFDAVTSGREAELYADTISTADEIAETDEYKAYARNNTDGVLKWLESGGITLANAGATSTESSKAGAWGNLALPLVGRWIGGAVAGDLKTMIDNGGDLKKAANMATMYAYIAENEGKEAADEYWNAMRTVTKAQTAAKGRTSAQEFAQESPGLASVDSVFGQLEAVIPNLVAVVKQAGATLGIGNDLTDDSALMGWQRRANDIRSTVTDSIDSGVGKFAYNAGMSLADNGVRLALNAVGVPAWVTELMAAGTAAGTVMQGEIDRGTDPDKALLLGVVAAIAEAVTEHIGLDEIYKAVRSGGSTVGKRMAGALVRAGLSEGTEELVSEATNMGAEALVLGDESQLAEDVQAYKRKGYTDGGALAMVIGSRLGEAGLGGLLAGEVYGGVGSAYQNLSFSDIGKYGLQSDNDAYRQAAEEIYASGAGSDPINQALLRSLSDVAAGDAAARQSLVQQAGGKLSDADAKAYVAALQSGDNETADRIAKASGITDSHLATAAEAGNRAMSTRTGIRGELADERKQDLLTEAVYKSVSGQDLTRKESRAIAKSTTASALADKYKQIAASDGKADPGDNLKVINDAVKAAKISTDGQASVDNADGTSADITIDTVRVTPEGVQVIDTDGNAHAPEDVTYKDDAQAYIVAWSAQMGDGASVAFNTISALPTTGGADPLQIVKGYTTAWEWAHTYGTYGWAVDKAMSNSLTQALPEEQRKRAYDTGREVAKVRLAREIKASAERVRGKYGNLKIDVADETLANLNNDQRFTLEYAKILTATGGLNVVITDKLDRKHTGAYSAGSNTITVNINAFKRNNSTTTRYTLSHELTHFAKSWAREDWEAYKDAMLQILADKGVDIAVEVEKLRKNYKDAGEELSYDDALEELICEGAQEMLARSELAEGLVQDHPGIAQKIAEFLRKIADALKKLLTSKRTPDSVAAQAVHDDIERLAEQWEALVRKAVTNAGAATKVAEVTEMTAEELAYAELPHEMTAEEMFADSGVKYQITPAEDEAYMAAVNNGDMETAQRLVDEAAEKAGYSVTTYHGTDKDFTAFQTLFRNEFGYHVGTKKAAEDRVQYNLNSKVLKLYTRLGKTIRTTDVFGYFAGMHDYIFFVRGETDKISDPDFIKEMGRKKKLGNKFPENEHLEKLHNAYVEFVKDGYKNSKANEVVELTQHYLKSIGVDSIAYSNTYEGVGSTSYLLMNSNQVKSAEPVTYDDNGNVIPLSQRFNTDSDDIRWQLSPADSLGLTAEELLANVDAETAPKYAKEKLMEYQRLHARYPELLRDSGNNPAHVEVKNARERMNALLQSKELTQLEGVVRRYMVRQATSDQKLADDIHYGKKVSRMEHQIEGFGAKIDEITQKYRDMLVRQREQKNEQILRESLRDSLRKHVKALSKQLTTDTAEKHVPQKLKMYAATALEEFTKTNGVFDSKQLSALASMYKNISADTADDALFDESIMEMIDSIQDALQEKSFMELGSDELRELRDVVKAIRKRIENENEMFAKGRKAKFDDTVNRLLAECASAKPRKAQGAAAQNFDSLLVTGNLKPVYFFRRMGGVLQELYQSVLDGQNRVYAKDSREDKVFWEDLLQRVHYNKWADAKDDILSLQSTDTAGNSRTYTLTREQALSIYATWKREHLTGKTNHLAGGGFVYQDEVSKRIPKSGKADKTAAIADVKPYAVTDANFEIIENWLTEEQKQFADEAVRYLSETVADRGNEISMKLMDIKIFAEGYYFPFEVSGDFIARKAGEAGQGKAPSLQKNKGFTKKTQEKATAPVVLRNFTEVVREHMTEMATYHAEALPQLDFWRVLNYKKGQISVKNAIAQAYGRNALNYIDNLLGDINKQLVPDYREKVFTKFLGNYKFARTAASLSVTVQQPSSIARAFAVVDPKYFVNTGKIGKETWDECYRHCGTAVIKDMGGFDGNTGRGAVDWLQEPRYDAKEKAKAFFTDEQYRNDVFGWGAMTADRLAWCTLWNAVKRETKAKMGASSYTKEVLDAAGVRFDEVVELTQVYDSVLTRSQHMRAKGEYSAMVTAFASENTVTLNMLMDAMTYKGPGRRKRLAVVMFSLMLNAFAGSLLKSLVTALRDDEEKPYIEKYLKAVADNFLDGINPLGMVVWVKDIWSILQGYDVERADMSLLADVYTSAKKAFAELEDGSTNIWDDLPYIMDAITAVGDFFNIPASNLYKDAKGIIATGKQLFTVDQRVNYERLTGELLATVSGGWYDPSEAGAYRRMYNKLRNGKTEAYEEKKVAMVEKKKAELMEKEGYKEAKALKQAEAAVNAKMKQMLRKDYEEKKLTLDESNALLKKYGLEDSAEDLYYTAQEWEYEADSDEQYGKYNELYAAVDANGNINAYVKDLVDHGAKKENVISNIRSHIGRQYRDEEITRKQAEQKLAKYTDDNEHDIYWKLDEWDYMVRNGSSEGYSKYNDFTAAVRKGEDLKKVISYYGSHGMDKDQLADAIVTIFKDEYLALKAEGKHRELKSRLLTAYYRLGKDRAQKSHDIDDWKSKEED